MGGTRGREDGQALLGAAVGLLVALVLVAVAVHVAALLVTRARASAAADHAALAAATALADVGVTDPTTAAGQVASALGARLVSCDCATTPVRVTVEVDVPSPLGRLPDAITTVSATGHAGLVTSPRGPRGS